MNNFFFWKNWPVSYKLLYFFVALVALGGFGYYLWTYELGNENVMGWEKAGELDVVEVVVDSFNKYLFEFQMKGSSYLLTESFVATDVAVNTLSHYLFLGMVMIGAILILVAISDLSYLWFGVGSMTFFLLLAFMNPENLGIFSEWGGSTLLVLMVASYLVPAFIFLQMFKQSTYLLRFVIYLVVTAFWVYYINENTAVTHPFLHLSSYGIVMPMLIAIAFILLVAHENIRAFVVFTTHESVAARKDTTKRFGFLAAVYLLNMIVAMLQITKTFDLGMGYIHPFYIFIASAIIGLWGTQHREVQYKEIMRFSATGAFLYMGALIICLASIFLAFANTNDPLVEVYEDTIMYSHIGFGVAMVIYVMLNFSDMMKDGQPVYKVLFRPMKLDYIYAMFFGVAIVAGLLFNARFFTYKQAFAGYNNSLGDLHLVIGDEFLSKQYYNLALGYAPTNHRSYYSLGNLAEKSEDWGAAEYFYTEAQFKKPAPYEFARLANVYKKDNRYFRALFALREGLDKFPESGELYNNLALYFNKTDIVDSVLIYLMLGREYALQPEVVESNMYAFQAKLGKDAFPDSLFDTESFKPSVATASNKLVYLNKLNERYPDGFELSYLPPDSVLITSELCYIYNLALNDAGLEVEGLLPLLDSLVQIPENEQFSLYLNYARATLNFKKGAFKRAYQQMVEVSEYGGRTNPEFVYDLGLWMLAYDLNEKAADYFRLATNRGKLDALLERGVALSELDDKAEAIEIWQRILAGANEEQKIIAHDILGFISPDSLNSLNLSSDLDRFRYLHYNQAAVGPQEFDDLFSKVEAANFKVVVASERALYLLGRERVSEADGVLEKIAGLEMDNQTAPYFLEAYLSLGYHKKDFDAAFINLIENGDFAKEKGYLQSFYQGVYRKYKQMSGAEGLLKKSMEQNPFYPVSYIELSSLYEDNDQPENAYNILVDGLVFNPNSIELQKAYALKCLDMGYMDFAETALVDLQDLMPVAQYQEFEQLYNNKKADIEKSFEDWN
ncbi:hypothetical protein R9C00_11005 [Flammeovirgaceae bacterium SG7u.111]|nr:hypothetical protein [Flammeovirgaceae bacterium SG7u.132]WPO37979.1 hypothetical protein R9C00_11005 [Flammeovirgaceae bacterium SG7u.111]